MINQYIGRKNFAFPPAIANITKLFPRITPNATKPADIKTGYTRSGRQSLKEEK